MATALPLRPTIRENYRQAVTKGELAEDQAQLNAIQALDDLNETLLSQTMASKSSALGWLFARRKPNRTIKGLYIWGGVGRGKTMLMNLFFQLCPVQKKRRAHFHEFMIDVHERVHTKRQAMKDGLLKDSDPVMLVADELADQTSVLCFDEFAVTDITDAMILARLFSRLFERHVVLVTTSNIAPDLLYKDGLNRDLFLPFVDVLKNHVDVLELDTPTDYRRQQDMALPMWNSPLDLYTMRAMDALWKALTGIKDAKPLIIPVKGHDVVISAFSQGYGRASFRALCEHPYGAEDYLALAGRTHTLFLDEIPLLDDFLRNETRRFILLIDTLYEAGCLFIASAEKEPDKIYQGKQGYEAFAFDRTLSRLHEMQSENYRDRGEARREAMLKKGPIAANDKQA
jgi:cell division protein ZapE